MSKLSYICGGRQETAAYTTIPEQLKQQAAVQPDKEAFIIYTPDGKRNTITYSELYVVSQKFASALMRRGLRKGERVLINLGNTIDCVIILFGLITIGVAPVSVDIIRNDLSDVDFVIRKTQAVGFFLGGNNPTLLSGLKRLVAQSSLRQDFVFLVDAEDTSNFFSSYNKLLASAVSSENEQLLKGVHLDPDDVALIWRSSGTTGRPKLIAQSHMNLYSYLSTSRNGLFKPSAMKSVKLFSNAEFPWGGGTPIGDVIRGGTKVTLSGEQDLRRAELLLKFAEKEACNSALFTNDILNTIVKKKLSIPSSIRHVLLGGSPVKKTLSVLLNSLDYIVSSYVCLEVGGIASTLVKSGQQLEDFVGGYPLAGVEIKIVGNNNETLELENRGRILVRKPHIFLEYVGEEEMTTNAVTPSGWYSTGDFGYISEEGQVFVCGRGECITRGIITLAICDVESAYEGLGIPQIEEFVAVPVPCEIMYEELCICAVVKDGYSITESELKQLITEKISAEHYIPKYIVFMDHVPVNRNGKLQRKVVTNRVMQLLSMDTDTST